MKTLKSLSSPLILVAATALFSSCEKTNTVPPFTIFAETVTNLSADPPSGGYDPSNGQPIGVTNKFTFYSFKTRDVVSNADSATTKWDIAFRGTTIIVNGGTSGPGLGGAIVQLGIFEEILTAPASGYAQDNANAQPVATYAVPKGSNNGWYNYNPSTNVITPIAGRILIFRTADSKYAKLEIISYYKDSPANPTSSSVDRYYTFRFVYQNDGTTKFK